MNQQTNLTVPIQTCQARCFVLHPAYNRTKAISAAGAHGAKIFGISQLWEKSSINITPLQRWLLPFWHVRCKSHFHYNRFNTYNVQAKDSDTVEISITGAEDKQLTFPVNAKANPPQVILHGIERCVTDRDVSELIDGYDSPDPSTLGEKAFGFLQNEQKRLGQYLTHPSRQVNVSDFDVFYQNALLDGKPIFDDIVDEEVQVVLPNKPASGVVGEVMKKVMVSIEPVAIHDWLLTVDTCDLYFRPAYIFQFDKVSKDGSIQKTKTEMIDALTGKWTAMTTVDVRQPTVPWNKVLLLTVEASAVIIQELGGPWLRVAGGILEVGVKHVPDIVDDMRAAKKDS